MKKLSAILAALALSGASVAAGQGVYTTNPYLDVSGGYYGFSPQFGIAGNAGPYLYGRTIPRGDIRTEAPGPISRIGTVRSSDGSMTGGNLTRTGAPEFKGGPAVAGITAGPASIAATDTGTANPDVTGALSGSYRAGVGGVGGLSTLGPRTEFGAVAGQALAAGVDVTPVSAPAPQTAQTAPLPTATTMEPDGTALEYSEEETQGRYTVPETAAPVGRRTYTATYETETMTERRAERPRRTIEK